MQELGVKTSCRATSRYVRACREGIAAAGVVLSWQQQQWLSSSAWVAAAAGVVLSWQQQQWLSSPAWVVKCYFYVRG